MKKELHRRGSVKKELHRNTSVEREEVSEKVEMCAGWAEVQELERHL